MIGNKYGHLTVTKMLPNYKNKKTFCLCDCDCGNKNIIREAYPLRNNYSDLTSCGCTIKEKVRNIFGRNIDGKKFGRLTVLETLWEEKPPKVRCRCDCGKEIILSKNDVQDGHTKSCGCLNKEIISEISTKDWTGFVSESGVKITKPLYQNKKSQWIWECICPLCNNTFSALPIKIYTNHTTSCGCKRISSGERIIESILKGNNIEYKRQYSFEDCKNKNKLKFDFAILKNNKLLFLIEYDGIQHFKPISVFGSEESYIGTVKRDKIKNEYCERNHIPLLRIRYDCRAKEIKDIIYKYIESVTTAGGTW